MRKQQKYVPRDPLEDTWSDDLDLGAAPPDCPQCPHPGRRTDLDLKRQVVEMLDAHG